MSSSLNRLPRKRHVFITALVLLLSACKKDGGPSLPTPPPPPPITGINYDLLHGWWKIAPGQSSYVTAPLMYFGPDSFLFHKAALVYGSTQTGIWRKVEGDSLYARISGTYMTGSGLLPFTSSNTLKILTLTSNSFVGKSGAYTSSYIKLDSAAITSKPVSTVAGNGIRGISGDGGNALNANISEGPLCIGPDGSIYTGGAYRIRKISPSGIITTIAGNGTDGFSGDGGPALNASISPYSLAIDPMGNLVFANYRMNTVRKVDQLTGIISTIVGKPSDGSFSGDGGLAVDAHLSHPFSIIYDDSGNLYISDSWNSRIRKVLASNGRIITIAGNGTNAYSGDGGAATQAAISPGHLAIDRSRNLIFTDIGGKIRKVDALTGIISTIAGSGNPSYNGEAILASEANFDHLNSVAIDRDGNIYTTDVKNHRIRQISVTDNKVYTVAGTGSGEYTGDGPHATAYGVYFPASVRVNETDNCLYFGQGECKM